jgi:hypothetical protein
MSVLTGLIGVVVGALLASWLARWRAVKEARVRHTLNLVDEFHSREMLKARNLAFEVLISAANPPTSVAECIKRGEETWISISLLLHYFDKVAVLLEAGWVDRKLLKRLLGRYVRVWGRYLGPSYLLLDTADSSDSSGSVTQRDWSSIRFSLEKLNERFAESADGPSPNRISHRFLTGNAIAHDLNSTPLSRDK